MDDPGNSWVRNRRLETTGSCGSNGAANGSKKVADGRVGSRGASSEQVPKGSERFCGTSRGQDASDKATKRVCDWSGARRKKTSERICGGSGDRR